MEDPILQTKITTLQALEIRVGTILTAVDFPEARNPAIKLTIDFGTRGILHSSAQITQRYDPARLVGTQVIAVVNFPPRLIAGFRSECLVLGAAGEQGDVVLIRPEQPVTNGQIIA